MLGLGNFGNKKIGFAITGSFCTISIALDCIRELVSQGADVTPIISYFVDATDTKYGKAESLKEKLKQITGKKVISTIPGAEPIGPGHLFDLLIILPATGTTLAKIATGIADTPVTMAAKSHLRNGNPILLGVSSNDALGTGAKNIGQLLAAKNIFFVPLGQDNYAEKPTSMVFRKEYVLPAAMEALERRQLQPLLA